MIVGFSSLLATSRSADDSALPSVLRFVEKKVTKTSQCRCMAIDVISAIELGIEGLG